MNTDLILFLEENGFSPSRIWLNEFNKRMHSKYVEELNVSIYEENYKKSLIITIWGETFAEFFFIIRSKTNLNNKIKKLLDILDEIIKANLVGHSIGRFFDYENIREGSFIKTIQYEDILVSTYAVVDISGDEAVFKLKTQ